MALDSQHDFSISFGNVSRESYVDIECYTDTCAKLGEICDDLQVDDVVVETYGCFTWKRRYINLGI